MFSYRADSKKLHGIFYMLSRAHLLHVLWV